MQINIRRNKRQNIRSYLDTKIRNLGYDWGIIEDEFTSIRNYIVHFSRIPSIGDNVFAIPYVIPQTRYIPIELKPVWSDYQLKKEKYINALYQMNRILLDFESVINNLTSAFLST